MARGSPVFQAAWCRHMNVPSPQDGTVPLDFTAPFDTELGLRFTELSPDGARAQLEVKPKLLAADGPGARRGLLLDDREYGQRGRLHLARRARRRRCRRRQQQHGFLAFHQLGRWCTAPPNRSTAAGVSSCGWSPSPMTTTGWWPVVRCGCRTSRRGPAPASLRRERLPTSRALRRPVRPAVPVAFGRKPADR